MIREPGFQPRETLPIRPRVYVKRADQKPLTWEDAPKAVVGPSLSALAALMLCAYELDSGPSHLIRRSNCSKSVTCKSVKVCHSSAFQTISHRSVYIKIINYSDSISANLNNTIQTKQHAMKKSHSYSNRNKIY